MSKKKLNKHKKENGSSAVNEIDEKSRKKKFPDVDIQSIIPVKQIYKGMIVTSDDRYVKIMEVMPINFSLRSDEEQANIIHLFASWLRIAPTKLQFKIITKRADTFEIINNIKRLSSEETQPKCRELTQNYIDFIQDISGNEALSRRFLLIFEYEPSGTRRKTLDEIAAEMEDTARKIRSGLNNCGNEVTVVRPDDEDYFQAEALYQFYNRRSCATEQLMNRAIRIASDIMKMKGLKEGYDEYPDIPVCDLVAPRGMDLTNPDYIIIDGQYQKILMVRRDGYPTTVFAGWISTLVESGDGIDIDIILKKEPRSYMRDKVALALKLNRITASGRDDIAKDYEEIEGAISSASYIKSCMASGEDFYHIYTFVTVSAETKEELYKRTENVFEYLYSNDIEAKEIKYRLEEAFQIVTPLLTFKPHLMEMAGRNILTSGAASAYPFTSCELCDENGIVLGINRRYHSLVNLDVFNLKKYKNANIAIVGSSGSGKTYTELTMALRMRIQGIQTFIISPDKAHEFRRACGHIGGSFIRISPGSLNCINVMEIRPVQKPVDELLDGYSEEEERWLYQKATQLRTFFKLLVPDITNAEEQLVDEAIIKTYNMFTITQDNNSLFNADGSVKKMPTLGDLYENIKRNDALGKVAASLTSFVTGSAQSFNQQTNVDLDNKFIVFDLSDLNSKMKAIGMFIVMDFLWSRIKENRAGKKALFIDEGWQLIGASADTAAADFVYQIFKTIRGWGGSAVFATQDISDLFAFQDGKYGKAIISNSNTKIVLGLESQEARTVKDVLQLTKHEVRNIVNFSRGEGLLCVSSNKLPIFIRASRLEDELITTDPQQLREMLERRSINQTEASKVISSSILNSAENEQKRVEEDLQDTDVQYTNTGENASSVIKNTREKTTSDDIEMPPFPIAKQTTGSLNVDKMTESERARYYEQEALMSIQAMEQMEATDITRDAQGNILPNELNDIPVVPTQKELEIFAEDEDALLMKSNELRQKEDGKTAIEKPSIEDADPNLVDMTGNESRAKPIRKATTLRAEGDDF